MEKIEGPAKRIFSEVSYFLACECNDEVKQYLKLGGATKEFYISDLVTHVISDTGEFALADEAKEYNIPVVTQNWVKMSVKTNRKLPTQPFSPKLHQLFGDVRVCPSKIPCDDLSKLWAMVTFHGGKCQLNLTPSCTHLVIPQALGEKYKVASKLNGKMKIVTPSWIIDCIKENKLLNEEKYTPLREEKLNEELVKEESVKELKNKNKIDQMPIAMETTTSTGTAKTSEHFKPPSPPPIEKPVTAVTPVAMKTPVTMETTVTMNSPVSMVTPKQESKEKGGVSKEDAQIKETPVKTEGESSDVGPLEHISTTRHKECFNEDNLTKADKTCSIHAVQEKTTTAVVQIDAKSKQLDNCEKNIESSLLAGCVFIVSDYQDKMDYEILNTWIEVIKSNGGEVQPFYSQHCTHLLCLNQSGKLFCQVLQDGKKIITAHWLNDVLTEKKMLPPSRALHFPVPFPDKIPECKNMTITVTGYTGAERLAVKNMIFIIGATYTGYLSRINTQMICKYSEGEKYIKAKEWGIPCVNAKWLGDIVSSGKVFPCALKKYSVLGNDDDLNVDKELVKNLLESWKNDIVPNEDSGASKRKKDEDVQDSEVQSHAKRQRLSNSITVEVNSNNPHVLFTGLTVSKSASLIKMLADLGGVAAKSPRSCTHLIATKIVRTSKFLSAISVCQFIVTPDWLEKSYEAKKFLDPKLFSLKDHETEKEYNMNLLTSLERAQARPLLQDIKVYATLNVQPSPSSLKEIVEAAGGQFISDKLSKSSLESLKTEKTKEGNPAFIVVTCQEDLKLCNPLIRCGIDIHSTEIILAGVLTQNLDYETYKVKFI